MSLENHQGSAFEIVDTTERHHVGHQFVYYWKLWCTDVRELLLTFFA